MRRFTLGCLLLVVFTVPWEGLVFFEGIGTLTRLLGYVALLSGLIAATRSRLRHPGLPHVFVAGYLFWCYCSSLWSVDPDTTVARVLVYLRLVGFAWLIWEFVRTRPQQIRLLHGYILGCAVSIVGIGWAAWMGASPIGLGEKVRYSGGGMNANELAAILAISVIAAVYLARSSSRAGFRPVLYWMHSAAASVAVLLTGSRAGFIVLAMGLAYTISARQGKGMTARFGILAVVASTILFAQLILPPYLQDRIRGIPDEVRYGSWSSRKDILKVGIEIVKEAPIVGIGCGAFGAAVRPVFGGVKDAHNTYLSVQSGTGVVGSVLFFSFPLLLFARTLRLPWDERLLWSTLFLMWAVMGYSGSMDAVKTTWFLFGLCLSWVAGASGEWRTGRADSSAMRAIPWSNRGAGWRDGRLPQRTGGSPQ